MFTNWLPFKRQIEQLGLIEHNNIVLDFSGTKMVDHSVMERLHEMELDFEQAGLQFEVLGLESHQQFSAHPHSARAKIVSRIRRVTIVAETELERELTDRCVELGASGYTSIPCRGAGRRSAQPGGVATNSRVRIEVVVPAEIAEQILDYIHREISLEHPVTACIETVEVLRRDQFYRSPGPRCLSAESPNREHVESSASTKAPAAVRFSANLSTIGRVDPPIERSIDCTAWRAFSRRLAIRDRDATCQLWSFGQIFRIAGMAGWICRPDRVCPSLFDFLSIARSNESRGFHHDD